MMMIKTADGSYLSVSQFKATVLQPCFSGTPPKELLARHKATYAVPEVSYEEMCIRMRSKRDALLQETDWMALSDVTMSAEMTSYRQALRDITDQTGFPYSVVWPTKP